MIGIDKPIKNEEITFINKTFNDLFSPNIKNFVIIKNLEFAPSTDPIEIKKSLLNIHLSFL